MFRGILGDGGRRPVKDLGKGRGNSKYWQSEANVHGICASSSPACPALPLLYLGLLCLDHQPLLWGVKVAEAGAQAHEGAALSSCLPVAAPTSASLLAHASPVS